MPTWEIVSLVILGIVLFVLSIRFGFFGLFLDILLAVLTGGSSSKSGGSGFGGGSSGGGGSSSKW